LKYLDILIAQTKRADLDIQQQEKDRPKHNQEGRLAGRPLFD